MSVPPLKDYYATLEVSPTASTEEIKRAYRKLALACHPDRNPGNREEAEEKFKEVTEAYGVLIDADKRGQYDRMRQESAHTGRVHSPGGNFSRERVIRDLFQNPYARKIFQDLEREFVQQGFRFDRTFMNKTLFGGKGLFIWGFFLFTPFGDRTAGAHWTEGIKSRSKGRIRADPGVPFLRKLAEKTGLVQSKELPDNRAKSADGERLYQLTISPEEAAAGTQITIQIKRNKRAEKLLVTIPPGIKPGTKLRLAGKGEPGRLGRAPGDLFIQVHIHGTTDRS